jgi:hypothetical protein
VACTAKPWIEGRKHQQREQGCADQAADDDGSERALHFRAGVRRKRHWLNRLGEDSSWDPAALTLEFSDILEMDPTVDLQIR